MGSYRGTRTRRPALIAAGIGVLVVTAGGCVVLVATLRARAEVFLPWCAFSGLIAFWVLMVLAMRSRPASLEVEGRRLRVSWQDRPIDAEHVAAGRWVLSALDTPEGVLLEIRGGRRRVWIGGERHDARGYPNEARPRRSVDLALSADDLDRLARELDVPRAASGATIELVRSSQSAGGMLRTMGPWLATIVVVSAFGVTAGVTGVAERLPPWMLGAITAALVIGGLGWTIVRSSIPRAPALVLRASERGVDVTERGETTTIPWGAVHGAARQHVVRAKGSTSTMPALELSLGDREVALAGWAATSSWGVVPTLRRSPRWLAGASQFQALVDELHRRGRLTV